jgi:predicted ATPase
MRLNKLWISKFKNLKDFSIEFDSKSPVTVLIGWNATGKSNLFEVISIIFRDLDLGNNTPFAYSITYTYDKHQFEINHDSTLSPKERTKINYPDWIDNVTKPALKDCLPSHLFGYYSGPSNRLIEHFQDHQRRYYDKVVHLEKYDKDTLQEIKSLRRLFCAQTIHSKFVLLAFFHKEDKKIKQFLNEYFRIVDLESVLFIMKKPSWARSAGHLWGAKGLVRKFLDRLYDISLAPMKLKQRVPTTIKKSKTEEFYYLYVKDLPALIELAKEYESQSEFFANLESTFLSEVIHDVRIKVKIKNHDGTLTFKELSEGEQQLLMVLGLLRFTKENESLVLLDEPDTHLNPAWSMEYLNLIKEIVGTQKESHIIMATHDPIVLASLERNQVKILKRNEENLQISADFPSHDPIGLGYTGILTSDMFGFRSDLDQKTLSSLDRKVELANKDDLSPEEQIDLDKINKQLDKAGFLESYSDPYYMMFIKAWSRRVDTKKYQKPFLTDKERDELAKIANEIMDEIDSERTKK